MAFYRRDGALYCEEVRISRLLQAGITTPFYLYSLKSLRQNLEAYLEAARGLDAVVGYAIKANHNPALCRELAAKGAGGVVVSANELTHALRCGFPREKLWLHGNGKRPVDLKEALDADILLSADSAFDLAHISAAAKERGKTAQILLRVNPDIDPEVHPYISTGLKESKFGIPAAEIEALALQAASMPGLSIRGVHCHLGSTLKQVKPFADAARLTVEVALALRQKGLPIDTVNLGGGLGIDYTRDGSEQIPSPAALLSAIRGQIAESGLRLLLEPGRSLVGNTGALICRVIGVKENGAKRFLVVDGSMAQLIRPSLYQAYHHVEVLEEATAGPEGVYDVVGPLCESGDFLAKERALKTPPEGEGIAVLDAGAYGFTMASRYNLHLLCAEYVVDGQEVTLTRRAETYEDFARTFTSERIL